MTRGEVYWYAPVEDARFRVVVLSSDEALNGGYVYAAPLARQSIAETPFSVPLTDPDPLAGHVIVAELVEIDPDGIEREDRPPMLTGATLARIDDALRKLLDI